MLHTLTCNKKSMLMNEAHHLPSALALLAIQTLMRETAFQFHSKAQRIIECSMKYSDGSHNTRTHACTHKHTHNAWQWFRQNFCFTSLFSLKLSLRNAKNSRFKLNLKEIKGLIRENFTEPSPNLKKPKKLKFSNNSVKSNIRSKQNWTTNLCPARLHSI